MNQFNTGKRACPKWYNCSFIIFSSFFFPLHTPFPKQPLTYWLWFSSFATQSASSFRSLFASPYPTPNPTPPPSNSFSILAAAIACMPGDEVISLDQTFRHHWSQPHPLTATGSANCNLLFSHLTLNQQLTPKTTGLSCSLQPADMTPACH